MDAIALDSQRMANGGNPNRNRRTSEALDVNNVDIFYSSTFALTANFQKY